MSIITCVSQWLTEDSSVEEQQQFNRRDQNKNKIWDSIQWSQPRNQPLLQYKCRSVSDSHANKENHTKSNKTENNLEQPTNKMSVKVSPHKPASDCAGWGWLSWWPPRWFLSATWSVQNKQVTHEYIIYSSGAGRGEVYFLKDVYG